MIRIAILGQPFWSRHLARVLNAHPDLEAKALPGMGMGMLSGAAIRWAVQADLLLRIGYRPGAPTLRGFLFDAFWEMLSTLNRQAKRVYYWIGTDVLDSLTDFRRGRLRCRALLEARKTIHWADAPWLVEELRELGCEAVFQPIPVDLEMTEVGATLPQEFRVLTYIPDNRADFYGAREVFGCARALPSVEFHVLGGGGSWAPEPLPNLTFHGWQADIRPFLLRSSVLLRIVKHDGMGGTVREALQAARHVIYTQLMPHTIPVPFGDVASLVAAVSRLASKHQSGHLQLNLPGMDYVQTHFDPQLILETYVALSRSALGSEGERP